MKHLVSIISPLSSCEEWEITHKPGNILRNCRFLQSKRKEEKQALRYWGCHSTENDKREKEEVIPACMDTVAWAEDEEKKNKHQGRSVN